MILRFLFVIVLFSPCISVAQPQCNETLSASDGAGGFLWKESDHGGLVVLFPSKHKKKFRRVKVFRKNRQVARLFYTGKANPDAGGNRQHWRDKRSINKFPRRAVMVQASRGKNKKLCWKVLKPRQRND